MQSLKSTAFAVTLLAISFGLYCFTTNSPEPVSTLTTEAELKDLIQIDTSASNSYSGSMTLPTADLNHQPAPIQISTELMPAVNPSTTAELPSLQIPKLNLSPPAQLSGNTNVTVPPPSFKESTPITLPTFTQSPEPQTNPLKLPEIATRQPVSTTISPASRDAGLIDALKPGNEFNPQLTAVAATIENTVGTPNGNDNSFNSLAAATEEEINRAKNADGIAMPAFSSGAEANNNVPPAPSSIAAVWTEVDRLVAADEYRKALGTLSKHFGRKGLTGPQQQRLQGWLDALAGKVIYSTEHHFVRRPYIVKRGETLESIARQLKVPAEVVYNINRSQFGVSNEVTPGMELKVINGPFHGEVNLETQMLTLFVQNLYAGSFPVAVGISGNPGEGNYQVMAKSPNGFTWRDATGKEYPPESPGNGYGPYWIGLSGSLCIHTVPSGTPHGHRGCLGLSENDARDVFGILSKESQISIVK